MFKWPFIKFTILIIKTLKLNCHLTEILFSQNKVQKIILKIINSSIIESVSV